MTCQLYLLTPPSIVSNRDRLEGFIPVVREIIKSVPIACLLLAGEEDKAPLFLEAAQRLAPMVQEKEVAFLLQDSFNLVRKVEADGVHLSNAENFKAARAALGPNYIVGVDVGLSRHQAIVAGEGDQKHKGADYIAFNPRNALPEPSNPKVTGFEENGPQELELLSWWQSMMTIPCVAMDDPKLERALKQAEKGADFVALQSVIWSEENKALGRLQQLSQSFTDGEGRPK